MKLKFVLVLLVILGLGVTGCNSTKEARMHNIKSKWISPTEKVCKVNGGKMDGYTCSANWSNAKKICSASGGRLATINELKKVVTDCGGIIKNYDNNESNSIYQDCYEKKGFNSSNNYWSSGSIMGDAWFINFYFGNVYGYDKNDNYYVRCIIDES